ncbi:hypothetical protein SAMN04487768_0282 [Burkholderia sp. b13]|nr:hypothetical protein SAMN04487768_0282 [Burkholderia sp. b13]
MIHRRPYCYAALRKFYAYAETENRTLHLTRKVISAPGNVTLNPPCHEATIVFTSFFNGHVHAMNENVEESGKLIVQRLAIAFTAIVYGLKNK